MNRPTAGCILSRLAFVACLAIPPLACGDGDGSPSDDAETDDTVEGLAPVELAGAVNNEGIEDVRGDGDNASVAIATGDESFSPTFVQSEPGAIVTVELSNDGSANHTFTIDDQQIDQALRAGEEATVEVTVPESGVVRFYCMIHVEGGMQGAFFTEAGAAAGDRDTTVAPSEDDGGYGY
jgi:plastocyanin